MKLYHFINYKKSFRWLVKSLLLGLAGVMAPVSKADRVPNPVEGDVFLAFRADENPGQGSAYLVKLGQDSIFKAVASGNSITVSIPGDIVSDLQSVYGVDWASRADLHWSAFGARVALNPTVYVTRPRISSQLPSPSWPALNYTERSSASTAIRTVIAGIRGYRGAEAAGGSPNGAIQEPGEFRLSSYVSQTNTAARNGVDSVPPSVGTSQFGTLSRWAGANGGIEGSFAQGNAGSLLDLYEIAPSGVTRLGTLSIQNSGVVTFSVTPEISPTQDLDGDGYPDLAEIEAGTDPENGSDFFRVGALTQTANGPLISAPTVPDKAYHLEYSEDLQHWLPIAYHASGQEGQAFSFTDTDPVRRSKLRGFYRLRLVPIRVIP